MWSMGALADLVPYMFPAVIFSQYSVSGEESLLFAGKPLHFFFYFLIFIGVCTVLLFISGV